MKFLELESNFLLSQRMDGGAFVVSCHTVSPNSRLGRFNRQHRSDLQAVCIHVGNKSSTKARRPSASTSN